MNELAEPGWTRQREVQRDQGRGRADDPSSWVPASSGRERPVITAVRPEVAGGRRPAKAAVGDLVLVEADVLIDGRERLACEVHYAHQHDQAWIVLPMIEIGNDRWQAELPVGRVGFYWFAVRARPDPFETWRQDLRLLSEAGAGLSVELAVGAAMVDAAVARSVGADRQALAGVAHALRDAGADLDAKVDPPVWALVRAAGRPKIDPPERGPRRPDPPRPEAPPHETPGGDATLGRLLFSGALGRLVAHYADPSGWSTSKALPIFADRERARFSTWYELFPRSASPDHGRAGTLADVERRLPYVAKLGFDVLYLPPIHPIGRTGRKGRDGRVTAADGDPGSPWAIGAAEGGHRAVHPDLGTLEDFRSLVRAAGRLGIDVAMDLAFQVSPDHPWVSEHPEWFRRLPDGSIRFASNPPKRYEDIYPLDFETESWPELWQELLGVARFWVGQGIRIFRVDNPHTKPFRFWEWFLASLKAEHPELIFLAEAFTRPKVMAELAGIGFTQSYTYFTWRNEKWELEQYLGEITTPPMADFLRPNFWPNTPDILTEALQSGGTAAFVVRLVLAATMAASYGIYGPAFELQEHTPRDAGSEEYAGSEKYEIRHWDLDRPESLAGLIALVNAIRRAHPALQHDRTLRFHRVDNDQLLAYSKRGIGAHTSDVVLVVANLDFVHAQSGWVDLDLPTVGLAPTQSYVVHDLLTDARYRWEGPRNFVVLDPGAQPVHVLSVEADGRSGDPR